MQAKTYDGKQSGRKQRKKIRRHGKKDDE